MIRTFLRQRFSRKQPESDVSNSPEDDALKKGKKEVSAEAIQLQRKRAFAHLGFKLAGGYTWIFYLLGAIWIFLFPLPQLQKRSYIDENALLPGQSSRYFTDNDLLSLPSHIQTLQTLQSNTTSSASRAAYLKQEMIQSGLDAGVQLFTTSSGKDGANAYGIYRAPRADGTEAIVYVAPWVCGNGEPNTNGIAYMLAFAAFVTKHSHWSRDLIILFSDAGLEGTHAFLEAYHGGVSRSNDAIKFEKLEKYSGVVNEAIAFEFPGTGQYDKLLMFVEGLNGQQPNADVISTLTTLALGPPHFEIVLHTDVASKEALGKWVNDAGEFVGKLASVLWYMKNQALGYPLAHHALFLRYKIEAVSLMGVPGPGGSGYVSPMTIEMFMESTLRCFNGLLERLHHSFWFYIMCTVRGFIPIAFYIAPVILLASTFLFQSVVLWTDASHGKVEKPGMSTEVGDTGFLERPVSVTSFTNFNFSLGLPLSLFGFTYAWSLGLFLALLEYGLPKEEWIVYALGSIAVSSVAVIVSVPVIGFLLQIPAQSWTSSWTLTKALTSSLMAITVLSVSVLNPSLSVFVSLPSVPVFLISTPSTGQSLGVFRRTLKLVLLQAVSPLGLLLGLSFVVGNGQAWELVERGVVNYKLYGAWFVPYMLALYGPLNLVLQAFVAWAHDHVTIHGLGAAVSKAVELALKLKEKSPGITWKITTSTVDLIDDVMMDEDE
ncbi:Glycosyl phosphatidyl inositol protein transamidase complex subunit, partial [Phlyctochytrium planicorne]